MARSVTRVLTDVVPHILSELDLDVVLNRVLEAVRELTGARYAAVGVLDESRTELERFVAAPGEVTTVAVRLPAQRRAEAGAGPTPAEPRSAGHQG